MSLPPTIVNPYNREYSAVADQIKKRAIRAMVAKRKVKIVFNKQAELDDIVLDNIDMSETLEQSLVLFDDNKNIIYRFPLCNIISVEETLYDEKKS